MPELTVRYDAPETVARFLRSDAFVRVIKGPVGSGKSSGSVVEILKRAIGQHKGPDGIRRTRFAIIRNTYPELRDTTVKTFEQWIPEPVGKWNAEEFSFTIRFADVECEVLFRALDKPKDVKKLLSLELTGCYFNELREIAKPIFDGMQGRVGRFPSKAQGGPAWWGVWGDTNPWHETHWLGELFEAEPKGHELYVQPSGLSAKAENVENLPKGYYQQLSEGKDQEWVDVYVHGKNAKADVGSMYGLLLEAVRERGDLEAFSHDTDDIHTSWDLGHDDSTAIWFWRIGMGGVEVVDHYESHSRPMSHYFDLVANWGEDKGYQYVKHWLPHDARAKTLQTGQSILDMCLEEWGPSITEMVPQLGLQDGITAVRWLLEREGPKSGTRPGPRVRFHPRCSEVNDDSDTDGLKCLRAYRRKWSEDTKTFSTEPVHDWASHTADAFRYLAVVVRAVSESKVRRREAASRKAVMPKRLTQGAHYSFTLDDLWKTARKRGGGRVG